MDRPLLIFLPGAGLHSSIWKNLSSLLDYPKLFIDYPNRSGKVNQNKKLKLEDYQKEIVEQINSEQANTFVIVAHSLGGIFCNYLASMYGEKILGIIAVGAIIPAKGESFLSTFPWPQRTITRLILNIAGTRPPDWIIKKSLCNDLSANTTDEVLRNFTPEPMSIFTEKIEDPVPQCSSLYILLEKDQEMPISLQRKSAEKLQEVKINEMNCGHLPMLSKPQLLAEHISQFVATVSERSKL